jgi:hypothetical protein
MVTLLTFFLQGPPKDPKECEQQTGEMKSFTDIIAALSQAGNTPAQSSNTNVAPTTVVNTNVNVGETTAATAAANPEHAQAWESFVRATDSALKDAGVTTSPTNSSPSETPGESQ